jgi:hypothetical protein
LRLDWAGATVAPPVRDVATTAMAKAFLIVELLGLLFPRQRLNLPHPRLRQRNARAAVQSLHRFHI